MLSNHRIRASIALLAVLFALTASAGTALPSAAGGDLAGGIHNAAPEDVDPDPSGLWAGRLLAGFLILPVSPAIR